MSRTRAGGRDFVEALARGIDVLTSFAPSHVELTVIEVADRTGLARPTVRRLLLTLEDLGYVRSTEGRFTLTAKVLDIGTAVIAAQDKWDLAGPHMRDLVDVTQESSSMAILDGSDIVYAARVAVPKIIALRVNIGSRLPAIAASMGKVLLADLSVEELDDALAVPSLSAVIPRVKPERSELDDELAEVRFQGWALADEILSLGVRSIAAPVRGPDGRVAAALNVTVHAAETSVERLTNDFLPRLLQVAEDISTEWQHMAKLPYEEIGL